MGLEHSPIRIMSGASHRMTRLELHNAYVTSRHSADEEKVQTSNRRSGSEEYDNLLRPARVAGSQDAAANPPPHKRSTPSHTIRLQPPIFAHDPQQSNSTNASWYGASWCQRRPGVNMRAYCVFPERTAARSRGGHDRTDDTSAPTSYLQRSAPKGRAIG